MGTTRLQPGEPLLVARAGVNRLLVQLRVVQRLHEAALPTALPTAEADVPPFLVLAETPVPVYFAEALLGAERVSLHVDDKLIELGDGKRRALLWVSAVEELVEFQPACEGGQTGIAGVLVAGFAAAPHPLPVLDAERLLELGERSARPVPQATEVQA